jgi:GNAT superfamily N-acetyltransferase
VISAKIRIRPQRPGEHEKIAEAAWEGSVYAQIFSREERGMVYANPLITRATWLEEVIGQPVDLVTAEFDGRAVGTGRLLLLPDNRGLAESFFVLPDYRGRGVGTRMWNYVRGVAEDLRLTELHVYVLRKNTPALAFYKKQGCMEFGTGRLSIGKHEEGAVGLRWGTTRMFLKATS